jgi:hypothetical protein
MVELSGVSAAPIAADVRTDLRVTQFAQAEPYSIRLTS